MLRLRYTSSRSLFNNRPCLSKCYTTLSQNKKSITEDIQPVKSIEDKDGITEVYIVRRNKNGKLERIDPTKNKGKNNKSKKNKPRKPSLLERLQNIRDNPSPPAPEAAVVAQKGEESKDPSWIRIPSDIQYHRVKPPNNVEVAKLAHGLDRVLFNPGVHYLKDPRTKQFNFTPFLEDITQPGDFDYEALTPYITSSRDNSLINMAKDMKQKYIGSTSSVSAVLSHFYFVMSNFKLLNTSCLSRAFDKESTKFTRGTRTAASIYLRWKDGVYAVDVDKSHDVDETVLSVMGKSLEKVLTLEPAEYERLLKENSYKMTTEEKNQPESYAYGRLGKFLLRSQLDCYDPRLPRGTFDLKTRAAVPVRLDIANYTDYVGYTLKRAHGLYESFEREYYDMIRSAFLKYSFQVRIGHMDGILVAYHNTRKIFGFQYISREEMDSRLFGSTRIGDTAFRNSLVLFESVLDEATKKYPAQTLRISLDTRANKKSGNAKTDIYVEAVDTETNHSTTSDKQNLDEFFLTEEDDAQGVVLDPYEKITLYELSTQSHVNGELVEGPLTMQKPSKDNWSVSYKLTESELPESKVKSKFRSMRKHQAEVYTPSNRPNPMLAKFKAMSEQVLHREQQEAARNKN